MTKPSTKYNAAVKERAQTSRRQSQLSDKIDDLSQCPMVGCTNCYKAAAQGKNALAYSRSDTGNTKRQRNILCRALTLAKAALSACNQANATQMMVPQLGPQNYSTSTGLCVSHTKFQNPLRATRTVMERLVEKIKNTDFKSWKPTTFTSSDYSEVMVHRALAANDPPAEVAFKIVVKLAKKMMEPRKFANQDRLLIFCLCKVLRSMRVHASRLESLELEEEDELSFEQYLTGVVWANQLLGELFEEGWGHQAVDLLLSCKSRSRRCINEPR